MPLRLSQPGQLRWARSRACGSSRVSCPAWQRLSLAVPGQLVLPPRLRLVQPVQLVACGGGLRQIPLQLLLCGILRRWLVQGRSWLLGPRQIWLLQAAQQG